MLKFKCPTCNSILEAPDHRCGEKIACPKCNQRLQIPGPPRNRTVLAESVAQPSPIPQQALQSCPHCGSAVAMVAALIGQAVQCPHCRQVFTMGGGPQPVPTPTVVVQQAAPSRRFVAGDGPLTRLRFLLWRVSTPLLIGVILILMHQTFVNVWCERPATHQGVVIASQSGLQAVQGKFERATWDTVTRGLNIAVVEKVPAPDPVAQSKEWEKAWPELEPAPLMVCIPVLLGIGALLGPMVPWRSLRHLFIGFFILAAASCLAAQRETGFPVEKAAVKVIEQGIIPAAEGKILRIEARPTNWFWYCVGACGLALLALTGELFDAWINGIGDSFRRAILAPGELEPDRGTGILVLGVVSLFTCWPLGLIAWFWANEDLAKMDDGAMNPAGRGSTQAGKWCGMIASMLGGISCMCSLVYLVFVLGLFGIAVR
jgi:hypothetical protein